MSWPSSWPTQQMQANRRRLEELRLLVNSATHEPEVGSELSRFLVIRASGYVEHTFETCIQHFAEAKSHPAVANYVAAGLFRGRNPKPDVLLERTRMLSEEWAVQLEGYFDSDDSRVRRELDFLIDRRNKIAHGQSESVHRRKALDLADVALEVGEKLTAIIDPR